MKPPRPGNWGAETGFRVRSWDAPISPVVYRKLPKHPLCLVLDDLRSAFNVGSIYRTADTARLHSVVTCGYTAHPPHAKLAKTALGTLDYVATRHFASATDAVTALRDEGFAVWGVETTSHSRRYCDVAYPRPLALLFGNEALGVDEDALRACEALVEIPMYGFKNSLNVAAAAAVVVFEVLRQWRLAAAGVNGGPPAWRAGSAGGGTAPASGLGSCP